MDEDGVGAVVVRVNKSPFGIGMEFVDTYGTFKGSVHMTQELYDFFCVLGHPQYAYLEVYPEEGGISFPLPLPVGARQELLEEEFLDATATD